MPRTSATHPIQIAVLHPLPGAGRIGLTLCPGKTQPDALTGPWARDLATDLDAIAAWGAAAVVTLIEPHEFVELAVQDLGPAVARRHMDWLHLPIPDYGAQVRAALGRLRAQRLSILDQAQEMESLK